MGAMTVLTSDASGLPIAGIAAGADGSARRPRSWPPARPRGCCVGPLGRSRHGRRHADDPGRPRPSPRLVSAAELGGAAAGTAPVYWVGPRRGSAYELTQTGQGRVFVRYLSSPAQLGSRAPRLPRGRDVRAAERVRRDPRPPRGGPARSRSGRRTAASPSTTAPARRACSSRTPAAGTRSRSTTRPRREAHRLVRSGAVTAVPLPGRAAHRLVVPARGLRRESRAADLLGGRARPGRVLELTETSQGNVFVRYVRRASDVGSPSAELPRRRDVSARRMPSRASGRPRGGRGAVTIRVPGGGLAVYDRARPTSVYLAYPGDDRQIEVFHPDARAARKLVRARRDRRGAVGGRARP